MPDGFNQDLSEDTENFGGYIIRESYTARFFQRQSPAMLSMAARLNGCRSDAENRAFRYCELGCGNGLTANVLAAAYPESEFFAVDFIPQHIETARAVASAAGLENITFEAFDFGTVLASDIEPFDFVTVHGVLSWIDRLTQDQLIETVSKILKPGGLAFVSYNCQPGWAAMTPFSEMMRTAVDGLGGNAAERAQAALAYMKTLRDGGAAYFVQSEAASDHLDYLLAEDPVYVAHEFLNEAHDPLYVRDVTARMNGADLDYLGSTNLVRNFDIYSIPQGFQDLIAQSPTRSIAEHHRSILRNEQFRDDVYLKSAHGLMPQQDSFSDLIIGSIVPASHLPEEFTAGPLPLITPQSVLHKLAGYVMSGLLSVEELICHPDLCELGPTTITQGVLDLMVTDYFAPLTQKARSLDEFSSGWELTSPLSAVLLEDRVFADGAAPLIAPVLGGGYTMPAQQSLCLWALVNHGPEHAAHAMATVFSTPGNPFVSCPVSTGWIEALLESFCSNWLPVLMRLGVVSPVSE